MLGRERAKSHSTPFDPVPSPRCIAIDWSGSRTAERRHIWCAEAVDGRVVALAAGRTRAEWTTYLAERARCDARIVVGLDFAFSFPLWFVRRDGAADVFAFGRWYWYWPSRESAPRFV